MNLLNEFISTVLGLLWIGFELVFASGSVEIPPNLPDFNSLAYVFGLITTFYLVLFGT